MSIIDQMLKLMQEHQLQRIKIEIVDGPLKGAELIDINKIVEKIDGKEEPRKV